MREGSEVVLFLTGIVLQGSEGALALALGSAAEQVPLNRRGRTNASRPDQERLARPL